MHPVATQRPEQLRDTDMTAANIEAATRLEVPFKISDSEPARFRLRWRCGSPRATSTPDCQVTGRFRRASGPGSGPRWRGSRSHKSMADHQQMPGRRPTIAKHSRPQGQTVAGYDLTFRRVKSVSTLR